MTGAPSSESLDRPPAVRRRSFLGFVIGSAVAVAVVEAGGPAHGATSSVLPQTIPFTITRR